MKKLSFKKVSLAAGVILAASFTGMVSAHDITNSLTAAAATDVFSVTCGTGTTELFAQIDNAVTDSRAFIATVTKTNSGSTTSPDNGVSPALRFKTTSATKTGIYTLTIKQTAGGATPANYHVLFHCQDINQVHKSTSVANVSDAP